MARPLSPPMKPAQKMMKKTVQVPLPPAGAGRLLITVNVQGSAGPIRFVVGEGELVAAVIGTALRCYAREGRFPVLGSDHDNFLLYCAHAGSDGALSPAEPIGKRGRRNFVLCKKQAAVVEEERKLVHSSKKGTGSWKGWLNKSLSFRVSSH